ncbi:MAG TPA: heparinase II/III family protein [Planctomycetota bacterium]|nr:heparinase II/III family protein [Planctomycetota bacterium]
MFRRKPIVLCCCCLLGRALAGAGEPDAAAPDTAILKTLRPGHPRLVALEADLARVREMIAKEALAREYHAALRAQAERYVKEPVLEYKLVGPRLLHVSRAACDRIYTLGLLFRLDGHAEFADRAVRELVNVCGFKDWHPSHFLDTAEMTHAAAIGYDWLHDRLTAEQRRAVVDAIVAKGLLPAKKVYDGGGWWSRSTHNWNQVCNGGIAIGALAVADERPELAAEILAAARASIVRAMRSYEPEGGWNEGPGYWHYATRYNVYYLAALQTALGTDLGLIREMPGFAKAGDFRLYFAGPVGRTFNYADAGDRTGRAAEMFWLARTLDAPRYAWHERSCDGRPDALDLLWFDPRGQGPKAEVWPLDRWFRGVEVAFLRSVWEDRDAVFVGFKGGDNRANHSHLDLGTFVLDALGVRWALDLGGDNYNLPAYFGGKRWTYYRLRTEGHNTLTLGGENQDPAAKAPILAFASSEARAFAVADLSRANKGAARWWRGIALLDRREVLVQDEVELKAPSDVVWAMHTPAVVQVAGATATLKVGEACLRAWVLEPAGARFETASATPPKPQAQNEGVSRLFIRLAGAKEARVAVLLTPYRGPAPPPTGRDVVPLKQWIAETPGSATRP